MEPLPVIYSRSRRARRLSLRILSTGEVKVTYPWLCPKSTAVHFFEQQLPWVEAHLRKMASVPVWPLLEGDTRQSVLERAKQFLPKRIADMSLQLALPFRTLSLRYMTSRYGSCSSGGRISLNTALVLMPRPLADSVIIHELCHTIHMDHSPAFHALMEEKARAHFAGCSADPLVQEILAEAAVSRSRYPLTHILRKRLVSRRIPRIS